MRFGLICVSTVMLVGSACARADVVTPVGGSGGGISGSGTLYVSSSSNSNGGSTITGITGTGVTGLLDAGGFNGNDNLLYQGQTPVLDGSGFAFTDVNGDTAFTVALFYGGSTSGYEASFTDSDGVSGTVPVDFTVGDASTAVTESKLLAVRSLASGDGTVAVPFTFATVAETPEPASFALMGTGLVGLATLVRRRQK